MSDFKPFAEFECPACGGDQDIVPPPAMGQRFRCTFCAQETILSPENTDVYLKAPFEE